VKASQIGRLYFFEIFTVANFLVLLFALRGITVMPVRTLGTLPVSIAIGFIAQAVIGVVIRLLIAIRHGNARELLATYRTKGWIIDTFRLAIFSGLWAHTYSWIKLTIPILHPRLFDQQLWTLDQAICFGYSPNFFFLTLFSKPEALQVIDWIYAIGFLASVTVVGMYFASEPDHRVRIAFMNANALLWLLGAWLYVAVPSLGPAYRFPEVWLPMAKFLGRTQHFQRLLIMNYKALLSAPGKDPQAINILFGVAAFPSLHVAFQVLAYLWMRRLTKWGGLVFGFFALFIFIGSIVTGWHYLIDGIAGAALAWLCYVASQRVPAIRA
jgi:hypothetical protein